MELPDLLAAYANDNRICLIDNTLKIEDKLQSFIYNG